MQIAERRKALRRVKLRWELCTGLGFTLDSKVASFCLYIIHLQYSRLGVCIGKHFKLGGLVIVRARAEQSRAISFFLLKLIRTHCTFRNNLFLYASMAQRCVTIEGHLGFFILCHLQDKKQKRYQTMYLQ